MIYLSMVIINNTLRRLKVAYQALEYDDIYLLAFFFLSHPCRSSLLMNLSVNTVRYSIVSTVRRGKFFRADCDIFCFSIVRQGKSSPSGLRSFPL